LWRLRHFSRGGFVLEKILRSAISAVRKCSKILKKQMILSPGPLGFGGPGATDYQP
jgi:hypothetical protein